MSTFSKFSIFAGFAFVSPIPILTLPFKSFVPAQTTNFAHVPMLSPRTIRTRISQSTVSKTLMSSGRASPNNLTQYARVIMAAVQIGTILSTSIVQPMYTPQVWSSATPTIIQQLQAVGFANLNMAASVQTSSSLHQQKSWINFFTMVATGLIYIVFPVKPISFTIPFVSILFILAATNAYTGLTIKPTATDTSKPFIHILPLLTQLTKFVAATATICFAFGLNTGVIPPMLSQVYLLQLALNVGASGIVYLQGNSSLIYDATLLGCIAVVVNDTSNILSLLFTIAAFLASLSYFLAPTSKTKSQQD